MEWQLKANIINGSNIGTKNKNIINIETYDDKSIIVNGFRMNQDLVLIWASPEHRING